MLCSFEIHNPCKGNISSDEVVKAWMPPVVEKYEILISIRWADS